MTNFFFRTVAKFLTILRIINASKTLPAKFKGHSNTILKVFFTLLSYSSSDIAKLFLSGDYFLHDYLLVSINVGRMNQANQDRYHYYDYIFHVYSLFIDKDE